LPHLPNPSRVSLILLQVLVLQSDGINFLMPNDLKTNVRHRRDSGHQTSVQFFSFYCYWLFFLRGEVAAV